MIFPIAAFSVIIECLTKLTGENKPGYIMVILQKEIEGVITAVFLTFFPLWANSIYFLPQNHIEHIETSSGLVQFEICVDVIHQKAPGIGVA